MNLELPYPIDSLIQEGEVCPCVKGDIIKKQFSRVDYFYILLKGKIHFYQSMKANEKSLITGMSQSTYAPIGLDAFIAPYRNETTAIVDSEEATLIRWEAKHLIKYLEENEEESIAFFTFLNKQSHKLIADTSQLFSNDAPVSKPIEKQTCDKGYLSDLTYDQADKVILLLHSQFFEIFIESDLVSLTKYMERREYAVDEIIIGQDEQKEGIYLLESGEVQYSRVNFDLGTNSNYKIPFRSISTPGYLISSSTFMAIESAVTCFVTKQATVLHISQKSIDQLCDSNRSFALSFQKRVLWLINNHLRAIRIRLVASQFNEELLVVDTLIGSNSTKLSINSPLHEVSVLLANKMTIPKALEILHQVELKGTGSERNLASLCLDNLHMTSKESDFYQALLKMYSAVAENTTNKSDKELQLDCIKASKATFSIPSIFTKGLEHFPLQSGCIFIYNHLINDEYYTLPNHFQITLDSHYLSTLIYERYGDQALRVVRIGKAEEYAHQNYYDRLGFIDVYTKDSDEYIETDEEKEIRHSSFFNKINGTLATGKNLIISPEGSSYATEQSPGVFKSGIFKVIQKMEDEPLIVPIVMVNFDKRISKKKFSCEIKKPFRLSEKMKSYGTKDIKEFLKQYQQEFKNDLQELYNLTANENSAQRLFEDEIHELKEKLSTLGENESTVFYGSSTIRLWESLEGDLANKNAVNLGFGGSSYEWCLHYFDQLFEDFHPKAFVLYGGDNDLSNGKTPEQIVNVFSELVEKIKVHSPNAPITVISVKPSPSREYLLPQIRKTNELLQSLVSQGRNMYWIETYKYMLSNDKTPRTDLFVEDLLHLSPKGYEIWKECVIEQLI